MEATMMVEAKLLTLNSYKAPFMKHLVLSDRLLTGIGKYVSFRTCPKQSETYEPPY